MHRRPMIKGHWYRLTITLALSLATAGCFPYRFVEKPGVSGTVLSSVDGSPVEGARIDVELVQGTSILDVSGLTTSATGSFHLEPKRFWSTFAPGLNSGPRRLGKLSVSAAGFEPQARELAWWISGPAMLEYGPIRLTPVSELPDVAPVGR